MTIGRFAIAEPVLSQASPTSNVRIKVPPKRLTIAVAAAVLVPQVR